MLQRVQQQIWAFLKRWRAWTIQFIIWIIFLIRDYHATNILLWISDRYGEKVEKIIGSFFLLIPKDISGWALFLLVITVCVVLIYDAWDVSREKGATKQDIALDIVPILQLDKKHLSLEIYNRESMDLEDCYITLKYVSFLGNTKNSKEVDFTKRYASNNPLLSWNSESKNGKKTISKHRGKSIINAVVLASYSKGFYFPYYQNGTKYIKKQGQYHIAVEINAIMKGNKIKQYYDGVFLFQYYRFDGEDYVNAMVNYQYEIGRSMAIHEDGKEDLIITQFGWMRKEKGYEL